MLENRIKMRIPTAEEWIRLMDITHEDNDITHWEDMYFWLRDNVFEEQYPSFRAAYGYHMARYWDFYENARRRETIGFRPAFEGLNTDNLTPDENVAVVIGTLYMDGVPVKVPQNPVWDGDIEDYIPGAILTLGPTLEDPSYAVRAIQAGDVYIADRVLLKNISCRDSEAAVSGSVPDRVATAKYADFRLGDDILRISQTETGISARIVTKHGESVEVFLVTHEERRFHDKYFFDNILSVTYDYDTPPTKRGELLHPDGRPTVYMRDGRLYCRKCHCWVPNTANNEMRKEGYFAHSHVCGVRQDGEVYEDAPKTERR